MREDEFGNIFIRPLHNDKFLLSEIDKNIYDEVLDLSNRFLLSSQILNNLIYDKETSNHLIDGLIKQTQIGNLKRLINQKELLKIAKLFNENSIDYVFMKGSAINFLSHGYVRYSRDLDILVCKESLSTAYKLLKEIGYRYDNRLVSDSVKYTSQTNHLPVLSNRDGALVEIHHRVTKTGVYSVCPLTDLMLKDHIIVTKNKVKIKISNINQTIAHLIYHAFPHHRLGLGPIFLYDLKYLIGFLKDEDVLIDLLHKMNLQELYMETVNFINTNSMNDNFKIYNMHKKKLYEEKNPKKFSYLLFEKENGLNIYHIFNVKFRYIEDQFQTSRFSFKFYAIIFRIIKNHFLKLLKTR